MRSKVRAKYVLYNPGRGQYYTIREEGETYEPWTSQISIAHQVSSDIGEVLEEIKELGINELVERKLIFIHEE